MKPRFAWITVIATFCTLSHMADAADNMPDTTNEPVLPVVEVSGFKYPEWKPYKQMLEGVKAFEENRALAPKAPLRFALRAKNPGVSLNDIKLTFVRGEESSPIEITEDKLFTMPTDESARESGELVLNLPKGSVGWYPHIYSPGINPSVRRLGDLRLECEVIWAIKKDDFSFAVRNGLRLIGGLCKSSKVQISIPVSQKIVDAELVDHDRSAKIRISKDGMSYSPQLFDSSWSNDATVVFHFSDQGPSDK